MALHLVVQTFQFGAESIADPSLQGVESALILILTDLMMDWVSDTTFGENLCQ
jgi:hypothetical protein